MPLPKGLPRPAPKRFSRLDEESAAELESVPQERPLRLVFQHALTGILIVLWYAASIVCNQTSKALLSDSETLTSVTLTLAQCIVSVGCGLLVMLVTSFATRSLPLTYGIHSRKQLIDTGTLAIAFTGGFLTLNASLAAMHVSLVMVLRAAEPLTTLLLTRVLMPSSSWPSRNKALAILPVVFGCGLSAVGPHGSTLLGLGLVVLSNGCFSLRAILGKRVAASHGTTALPLFWQLCVLGSLLQTALLPVSTRVLSSGPAKTGGLPRGNELSTVIVNGASFYAYLQLSFVCLGRMTAVSHSVTNSMRRPATIFAAIAYAPIELTPLNYGGIAVACGASLVYGLLK